MSLAKKLSARFRPSHVFQPAPEISVDQLNTRDFLELAYKLTLGRSVDPAGVASWGRCLDQGLMTRDEVMQGLVESAEFRKRRWDLASWAKRSKLWLDALHAARLQVIVGLPKARVIVDLGGSCEGRPEGAMIAYGYPYAFERMTIVDLPREQRHAIYAEICGDYSDEIATPQGPVRYLYTSLADLSAIADHSTDLVYSGQSIEHVTRDDAARACREVLRILKPGGFFCLDTPNRAATAVQYPNEYCNPDHKYEYTHAELSQLLTASGFVIREAKGISLVAESIRTGMMLGQEATQYANIYDDIENCYLLYYKCQKD